MSQKQMNDWRKDTKYRVLMHAGVLIDSNLLEKGLYGAAVPCIYSHNTTIEMLIAHARSMSDLISTSYKSRILSDSYFENLQKCELVEVTLNFGGLTGPPVQERDNT